jgi:hypothetical protein
MPRFQEFKRPRNAQGRFIKIPVDLDGNFDLNDFNEEPEWEYYDPTKSINPPRPRTEKSRYNAKTQRQEIMFRGGEASYVYEKVTPAEWLAFKKTDSPGRFINNVLNAKPYARGGYGGVDD